MSKALAWFLCAAALVGGILLGNQYGRRDVVNSRPPVIERGNDPKDGGASAEGNLNLQSLLVFNPADNDVYGSASIVQQNGAGEIAIYLQRLPPVSDPLVLNAGLRVSLFSQSGQLLQELGVINPNRDSESLSRLPVPVVQPGQYLGLFGDNETPVLVTTRAQ